MRRRSDKKQADDGPVVPPVPGSGASLPPRPPELAKARDALFAELGSATHVATGFATDDGKGWDTAAWRLFVFTDDKGLTLPKEFMGFKVNVRPVPAVSLPPSGRRWRRS